MNAGDELQSRLDAMLQDTGGAAGIAPEAEPAPDDFSPFDFAQADRASELAAELSRVRTESGLEAALAAAEGAVGPESPGLVKHALKVFVTHDAEARERLRLPSVEAVATHEVEGEPPPPRPTTPGAAGAVAEPEEG